VLIPVAERQVITVKNYASFNISNRFVGADTKIIDRFNSE